MLAYFNPVLWFRWVLQFFLGWVTSIPWKNAALASPFLVVLLVMGAGLTIAWTQAVGWRTRIVERALFDASREGNFKLVELLVRRRLREDPKDQQLLMQLALTYNELGRRDEALELFHNLVDDKKNGDAAAWLIENELKPTEVKEWNAEKLAELGRLSGLAVTKRPGNLQLQALRADYYMLAQQPAEAIPHLETLVPSQPMRGLQIAAIYRALGNEKLAEQFADNLEKRLVVMVKDDPKNSGLRMALAQTQIFLRDYENSLRTLVTALQETKEENFRLAIAEGLVLYSNELAKAQDDRESMVRRFKALQSAATYAPASPLVVKAITDVILSTIENKDKDIVALRTSLLNGTSPGMSHFIQGTAAMMQGNAELASIELELAVKDLPQSSAILNNLAVAKLSIAKSANDPTGMDQALTLVNKALELQSKEKVPADQLLYFYETRGQIHLAKKQYLDAISDLEKTLVVAPLKSQAHRALAEAYQGLGQESVAAAHLQQATEFDQLIASQKKGSSDALEKFGQQLRNQTDTQKPDNANAAEPSSTAGAAENATGANDSGSNE